MATARIFYDMVAQNVKGECPVKLVLSNGKKVSKLSLGISILPSQWNGARQSVVHHPMGHLLNMRINHYLDEAQRMIYEEQCRCGKFFDVLKIRKRLEKEYLRSQMTIENVFEKVIANKEYSNSTKELYRSTLNKYKRFCARTQEDYSFEDIDVHWLDDFDDFLAETAPKANARSIDMRNLRHIFNVARREEITDNYPFSKFTIKQNKTRKRSVSQQLLHRLFFMSDCPKEMEKYRDTIKLIFYLRGINVQDLFNLKKTDMFDGRISYIRAKTKKEYSIKVEPEIKEIIDKYNDKSSPYLINTIYHGTTCRPWGQRINRCISSLKIGDETLLPEGTSYWLRHSWATIASRIGIPVDTISEGLGHEIGSRVTHIYIDFDMTKVDDANRQIMDAVINA